MLEEQLLDYVREKSNEWKERIENTQNPVLEIEDKIKNGKKENIHVTLDRIKKLKDFKNVWPESEESISFEKRCYYAKNKQHFHKGFIELLYVCQGNVKNYIGSKEYDLVPGELWLIGKSVYHGIVLSNEAIILNIGFNPYIMRDFFEDPSCHDSKIAKFLIKNCIEEDMNDFLIIPLKNREKIYDIIYQIIKEGTDRQNYHHKITQYLVMILFTKILQFQQEELEEEKKEIFDIYKLYSYISNNYTTATLSKAAEIFHFSPSTLSRMIQKETGKNFSTLVRSMKLRKAKELLANTEMSIEEIAEYLKYSNRFSFERAFGEMFKISPKCYRESLYNNFK